ncbi:hypothetical protein GCM10009416_50910 [Craurococcus roseus]|uniref:Methyltransferase domain-containing protein n=1 Tax=Craurococcus roseus TaxID=77585 RepID=A0ABP3RI07_9PROT
MDGDPIHRWIADIVPGRSFVDIGGIGEWSKQERVTQSVAAGAARSAMADIEPADSEYWRFFHKLMYKHGIARDAYDSHAEVDVTRADLAERLPPSDVVHCTGVLYHCPDPVAAVDNLRRVTGRWLIVNTVVCPQRVENAAGTLALPSGAALFLPGLSEAERDVLRLHYRTKFGWSIDDTAPRPRAPGVKMPHVMPDGRLNHWPYWWLFTIHSFRSLLQLLRFDIRDEWTWEDHAHCVLCERVG